MRIALTGASGFFGVEFLKQIHQRGHQSVVLSPSSYRGLSARQLVETLKEADCDCLINCAGYTGKPNVDACENDKVACLAANSVLPGIVSQACTALKLPWGHLSSGCIYTGTNGGDGFKEDDTPNFTFRQNNCSFYSGSKALGEEVLSDDTNCYVWRLRIPFSNVDSPRNYLSKLIQYERLLEADNSLSDLSESVVACLECFEKDVPKGIYNMTNPGHLRASDIVKMMNSAANDSGYWREKVSKREFQFFASESEFMSIAAKTPRSNCVLNSSKAVASGLTLTNVRDAVHRAIETFRSAELE